MLTSLEIFLDLPAELALHERRLAEGEVWRHAPVPDFGRWEGFVEGVGSEFVVEGCDCGRVGGGDYAAAAALEGVRGAV